jgi:SAM-dependent methyltransferase
MDANARDREFSVSSMRRYAEKPQELDKLLERLARPFVAERELEILDAGCGIGHVAALMARMSDGARVVGVDRMDFMVDEASELWADQPNLRFEPGDVIEFASAHPKAFDLTISWKVLSWLDDCEPMLEALMAATRGHLFISSLFYDGDIDFRVDVTERAKAREGSSDVTATSVYHVYSLPWFVERARELGAADVTVEPFEIEIDLPRGDLDRMGTYTEQLADGRRLQLSGALTMPWKVLRIDL